MSKLCIFLRKYWVPNVDIEYQTERKKPNLFERWLGTYIGRYSRNIITYTSIIVVYKRKSYYVGIFAIQLNEFFWNIYIYFIPWYLTIGVLYLLAKYKMFCTIFQYVRIGTCNNKKNRTKCIDHATTNRLVFIYVPYFIMLFLFINNYFWNVFYNHKYVMFIVKIQKGPARIIN